MLTSIRNGPGRRFRLIGPATYILGLIFGAAGLCLSGCGDEKGQMTQIKNENPLDRTKESQNFYLKNAASHKKGMRGR